MKVTAKLLSALAIMVFMAVPAIASANALANEVAVEVVDAPKEDKAATTESTDKKACCAKTTTCDKAEKKACTEKKEEAKKAE